MKLAILDRDGTLNPLGDDFITSPEEWSAQPGALEAVARLRTLSRTHLRQPLRSPQLQDRRPENADPSSH